MKNKAMDASCSRRDFLLLLWASADLPHAANSSSAESKNGRVYYLNKKAEEQSTWVKLGKAFEKETGIPVQIQTGGTDYDATLRSELSKKAAPTMSRLMARAS